MNILSFLPLISTIIDKVFMGDKQKQTEAKAQLVQVMSDSTKDLETQSKVIVAEAQGGSAAQRNWRPHLMYLFMIMIAYNYILAPLLTSFGIASKPLDIPEHAWWLIDISVGGYIVGRSGEKITNSYRNSNPIIDTVTDVISAISKKGK